MIDIKQTTLNRLGKAVRELVFSFFLAIGVIMVILLLYFFVFVAMGLL